MNVCVQGLWHLGSVTAACMAAAGHDVIGLDDDPGIVEALADAHPPVGEPGLTELVRAGLAQGKLRFTADASDALRDAEVLWVAYDTPVDQEDHADVEHVVSRVRNVMPLLRDGTLVLVSSQLPVGTCGRLEREYAGLGTGRRVGFACSPENLRLGKAISAFQSPDRIVVGSRTPADVAIIERLLVPLRARIEWMSVESAEMTKHAVNAFLAVSVAFANELATLCEQVAADAKEVERGLKSESRIGPKAYLSPGAAFAGGTLARDINFLTGVAARLGADVPLLGAVQPSNNSHKAWASRRLERLLGGVGGKTVAVWGLTYKPGTDTLRRSSAVELCRWLLDRGAAVRAHDPAVTKGEGLDGVSLFPTAGEAARGADAVVVMTQWPQFRDLPLADVLAGMRSPNLLDASRFLAEQAASVPRLAYLYVGAGGRGTA